MRIFTPIPICLRKFSLVQIGLVQRKSPLKIIIPPFGPIMFTPVQVSNIKGSRFESRILFNPYPHLEINTVQNSFLPHVYNDDGDEITASYMYKEYKTYIDHHLVSNIRVSSDLANYDILLCSNFKNFSEMDYASGNKINLPSPA